MLADGVYLSDGYINIALLKYKSDEMAGVAGGNDFVGTHHFGFQVEDAEAAAQADRGQRRPLLHGPAGT